MNSTHFFNADGSGHSLGGGLGAASGSSTPAAGGTKAPTRTSNANTAALYQAVAQVATSVIDGFFAKGREREANALQLKFQEMQNRLELLSADTQLGLLNKAYSAQSENEKLALLNQVFALVATAQLQSTAYNPNESYIAALTKEDQITQVQSDKRQDNITIGIFFLVGIAVLAAAFIEYKKMNK